MAVAQVGILINTQEVNFGNSSTELGEGIFPLSSLNNEDYEIIKLAGGASFYSIPNIYLSEVTNQHTWMKEIYESLFQGFIGSTGNIPFEEEDAQGTSPLIRLSEAIFEKNKKEASDILLATREALNAWSAINKRRELREEFEKIFKSPGPEKWELAEHLKKIADADSLVQSALDQFQERGNEERLILASALLESYGRAALHSLYNLAHKGVPECEYFIDTLANLAADPSLLEPMFGLLQEWSRHPQKDVRLKLLEISDSLPKELRTLMLNNLVNDQDEEVSELAREILQ